MERIRADKPKPKTYFSLEHAGACARSEGLAIDDIQCRLLRDPDMAASWRAGWKARDAELVRRRKGSSE